MFRTLAIAAFFGISVISGAALASDADNSPLVKALFGKLAAKGKTSVCFTRVYTPAHLASHPQQNVRDMVILMSAEKDADAGGVYSTHIGVHFRKLGSVFETGGSCGIGEDGKAIHCGVDCDGGSMDVELKDAETIYLKIPDGARLWQPGSDDDNPAKARFGSDDKIFKLTRASGTSQCMKVLGKQ
jgi:hypothetical protein